MSQIFRREPPFFILMELLDKYADKDINKKYVIDYVTFKRVLYHNYHLTWLKDLYKYYYKSKTFYVMRKFTFSSFLNIIRQLCKIFNIQYSYVYDRNQNYHHLRYTLEL